MIKKSSDQYLGFVHQAIWIILVLIKLPQSPDTEYWLPHLNDVFYEFTWLQSNPLKFCQTFRTIINQKLITFFSCLLVPCRRIYNSNWVFYNICLRCDWAVRCFRRTKLWHLWILQPYFYFFNQLYFIWSAGSLLRLLLFSLRDFLFLHHILWFCTWTEY